MKTSTITRREFIGLSAGCLLVAGGTLAVPDEAFAASAYSSKVSFQAGGKTYYGQSMISTTPGQATGWALTSASSVVDTGWLGADVRVYNGANGRIIERNRTHSAQATQYYNASLSVNSSEARSFKCDSIIYGWNGSSYASKTTPYTPNVDRAAQVYAIKQYPVCKDGFTFGSLLSARYVGFEPDLILVSGQNGIEGYVRRDDFLGSVPSSPEEAVALFGHKGEIAIPVYNLSGDQVDIFVTHTGGGSYENPEFMSLG